MPFWCDGSVRLRCGQNVTDSVWAIVGKCGQLWAMKNYAWLWPPRELVLLSLHYCRVRCPKPQNQAEVLLLCGLKIFMISVGKQISISGGSGIRPSCSSCSIKPKSNGYKRDVVNTSIGSHLFEINSFYFLCNLFFFPWRASKLNFICMHLSHWRFM